MNEPRIYICQHFRIEELVPPEMFEAFKYNPVKLWMLFDRFALITLDLLRERYGTCTVNNWLWDGNYKYSGWRPFDCKDGAKLSQHKWGRGFDAKFKYITPQEIWQDMIKNPNDEAFRHIRRIEAFPKMTWFHFDTGNVWRPDAVRIFGNGTERSPLPDFIYREAA
ncbi:MAG: hypothetical protein ACNI27_08545 [Desulfovibrio sp.]